MNGINENKNIVKPRVRFAPSPTGYLHVGGARSALFNYLFAKRHGGTFILRIEDTDRSRFVEDALAEIYDSLKWLGISCDESPKDGGAHGPYTQSERLDIYNNMAQRLLDAGHAYKCFCTSERLADLRAQQEKNGGATGYDRKCRGLSAEETAQKIESGEHYVIRFKIPENRTITFDDLIRGNIEYQSDTLDDFVLLKTDKFPTYHMASVVDDHEMEITHVLRGDEWIASTPRHVLLYEAFGWSPPAFAHLPVILSPDGGKLSKRKGAASVMDYKRAGFLPEALFNFLALLGWSPGDDREIMNIAELADAFSLSQVSPKASVFDEKKLEWMNGQYMAKREGFSLAQEIVPLLRERGYSVESADNDKIIKIIDMLKERSRRTTELADSAKYFFEDPKEYDEKTAKKVFHTEGIALLSEIKNVVETVDKCEFKSDIIEEVYKKFAEQKSVSIGQLILPTRLAISGAGSGPGVFEIMEVLGKDAVLRRLGNVLEK